MPWVVILCFFCSMFQFCYTQNILLMTPPSLKQRIQLPQTKTQKFDGKSGSGVFARCRLSHHHFFGIEQRIQLPGTYPPFFSCKFVEDDCQKESAKRTFNAKGIKKMIDEKWRCLTKYEKDLNVALIFVWVNFPTKSLNMMWIYILQ